MQDFINELLARRGIVTDEERERFFNPDYERDTHDPFLLPDMLSAVDRIIDAIDAGERIAIYSDFDADGIPAGVIVREALEKMGHTRMVNYIPHRDTEGYGFHANAVEKLAREGVTLIITVDVGITAHDAVDCAREHGVDIIITDHHLPAETLPSAYAVINPQRADSVYPYRDLCGSGVAFKLVHALIAHARTKEKEWVRAVPEGWEKWLLDLVAIATIGDMVPLTGENRVLVYYGLLVFRKTRRAGLIALCRTLRLSQPHIQEDDIGFSIAPRINASSRMGSPETAFELLRTTDDTKATELARSLERLNNQRKAHVAHIVKDLKKKLATHTKETAVLVAGDPQWNPALLGLAANAIVDTFGRTTCLWGRDGTGALKGSCRSNGDIHVVELFEALGDALVVYGGHEYAGGFTVATDAIHTFADMCNEVARGVCHSDPVVVHADTFLPRAPLAHTYRQLSALAPFGMGNEKPCLEARDVSVTSVRQFGKDDAHVEVRGIYNDIEVRAIAFFKRATSFTREPKVGERVSILSTVACSRFGGRVSYELRIVDIV